MDGGSRANRSNSRLHSGTRETQHLRWLMAFPNQKRSQPTLGPRHPDLYTIRCSAERCAPLEFKTIFYSAIETVMPTIDVP